VKVTAEVRSDTEKSYHFRSTFSGARWHSKDTEARSHAPRGVSNPVVDHAGGFTPASRAVLFERLKGLRIKTCPFANLPNRKSGGWNEGVTDEEMAEMI
jgi:hypothetical protein